MYMTHDLRRNTRKFTTTLEPLTGGGWTLTVDRARTDHLSGDGDQKVAFDWDVVALELTANQAAQLARTLAPLLNPLRCECEHADHFDGDRGAPVGHPFGAFLEGTKRVETAFGGYTLCADCRERRHERPTLDRQDAAKVDV